MNGDYEPSVDRFLLPDTLENFKGKVSKRVVEVGSGSCNITMALAKLSGEIFTVDISDELIRHYLKGLSPPLPMQACSISYKETFYQCLRINHYSA